MSEFTFYFLSSCANTPSTKAFLRALLLVVLLYAIRNSYGRYSTMCRTPTP